MKKLLVAIMALMSLALWAEEEEEEIKDAARKSVCTDKDDQYYTFSHHTVLFGSKIISIVRSFGLSATLSFAGKGPREIKRWTVRDWKK